jgi:hypothetical protein
MNDPLQAQSRDHRGTGRGSLSQTERPDQGRADIDCFRIADHALFADAIAQPSALPPVLQNPPSLFFSLMSKTGSSGKSVRAFSVFSIEFLNQAVRHFTRRPVGLSQGMFRRRPMVK